MINLEKFKRKRKNFMHLTVHEPIGKEFADFCNKNKLTMSKVLETLLVEFLEKAKGGK